MATDIVVGEGLGPVVHRLEGVVTDADLIEDRGDASRLSMLESITTDDTLIGTRGDRPATRGESAEGLLQLAAADLSVDLRIWRVYRDVNVIEPLQRG